MDKFYKEFFRVYLTECEKTRELVKQENEQARNLIKELITTGWINGSYLGKIQLTLKSRSTRYGMKSTKEKMILC